jgi:hypothetical protein
MESEPDAVQQIGDSPRSSEPSDPPDLGGRAGPGLPQVAEEEFGRQLVALAKAFGVGIKKRDTVQTFQLRQQLLSPVVPSLKEFLALEGRSHTACLVILSSLLWADVEAREAGDDDGEVEHLNVCTALQSICPTQDMLWAFIESQLLRTFLSRRSSQVPPLETRTALKEELRLFTTQQPEETTAYKLLLPWVCYWELVNRDGFIRTSWLEERATLQHALDPNIGPDLENLLLASLLNPHETGEFRRGQMKIAANRLPREFGVDLGDVSSRRALIVRLLFGTLALVTVGLLPLLCLIPFGWKLLWSSSRAMPPGLWLVYRLLAFSFTIYVLAPVSRRHLEAKLKQTFSLGDVRWMPSTWLLSYFRQGWLQRYPALILLFVVFYVATGLAATQHGLIRIVIAESVQFAIMSLLILFDRRPQSGEFDLATIVLGYLAVVATAIVSPDGLSATSALVFVNAKFHWSFSNAFLRSRLWTTVIVLFQMTFLLAYTFDSCAFFFGEGSLESSSNSGSESCASVFANVMLVAIILSALIYLVHLIFLWLEIIDLAARGSPDFRRRCYCFRSPPLLLLNPGPEATVWRGFWQAAA